MSSRWRRAISACAAWAMARSFIEPGLPRPQAMPLRDGVAVIAGSALGGGFLALPLVTQPMGFGPALLGLLLTWIFLGALSTVYADASELTLQDKAIRGRIPEDEGVSVASVAELTLGRPCAVLCSVAFLLQMLAVLTAQVAKAGEILEIFGLPYGAGCLLPSILLGLFVFRMPADIVERSNTFLTALIVVGFGLLMLGTVGKLGNRSVTLPAEDWSSLLPRAGTTTWPLPIFFNLLCYGQAVPLLVERMGSKRKVKQAILFGSLIPLVLGVMWVLVAALLGEVSTDGDPVLRLIRSSESALPVLLLAGGAIGSTLLASYLALAQFTADALCAATGSCSPEDNERAKVLVVMLPALTACLGPQLYLPLLAFAGAFPSVLLYGLLPPLALLSRSPRRPGLVILTLVSLGFLLVNLWLWFTSFT